jgi:uncharacterized cupredoxin-like copper-binding protein
MRTHRAVAAALLLAAGAACAPAQADPAGPRTVEIVLHHSRFEPSTIRAEPGETLEFVIVNTDPIDHEFIVGDQAVQELHERGTEAHHEPRPGEVTVLAGETVTTTFTFGDQDLLFGCHVPGHYTYGMRGVVLVG